METKDALHIIDLSAFYDGGSALTVFLSGLEDQLYSSGKFFSVRIQIFRRTQQSSRMSVVPAGMHHPGVTGTMGEVIEFFHLQGVNVAPQSDNRSALPARHDRYGAGGSGFPPGDALAVQVFPDICRSLILLHAGFRVLV